MRVLSKKSIQSKLGTFFPNHKLPFHGWYSYLEGYSSKLVENELDKICFEHDVKCIYDPFGGTGTTPLVASQRGIKSYYSETNPFMLKVIDAKINSVKQISANPRSLKIIKDFYGEIVKKPDIFIEIEKWGGFEKYYSKEVLNQLLYLKEQIQHVLDEDVKKVLMVILSSLAVQSSLMKRQGDLRRAKESEKHAKDFEIYDNFLVKLKRAIDDIENVGNSILSESHLVSEDARDLNLDSEIDCVITSPPYLNGTNYIRNTKLELKLNDCIIDESELPLLHSKGIIAGINNVSKRKEYKILPCVEPYYHELLEKQYDSRISKMVAGYFYDMDQVFAKLSVAMTNEGFLVIDIGDSQFSDVHIPTHDILSEICESHGFRKYSEDIIRERTSHNGMKLSQRIMRFRLFKSKQDIQSYYELAEAFVRDLPYKKEPYCGRNWGHDWHSLCSYHGKLKPGIAHHLVSHFSKPGEIVLDPLSGVGTIPFEACIQGRKGIGNDLSELAFIVTKAKLEKPEYEDVLKTIDVLKKYIDCHITDIDDDNPPYATFGLNGKIPSYYDKETYKEILCARSFFKGRIRELSAPESMVLAALAHILHGNRPYALSRRSHPLTPYAPKGEFEYKNLVEHLIDKVNGAYKCSDFGEYLLGQAIYGDFRDIDLKHNSVDVIICSPPFADSMRFYSQNWLRLWFCGWEPEDFVSAKDRFIDDKQNKDMSLYVDFFEMCNRVLKPKGKVILHLGRTKKIDMAEELSKLSSQYFLEIYRGEEDVSSVEKHGIKDKGSTITHQYLFLEKKQ